METLEGRRLIDLAALQLGNRVKATELLMRARELVKDPDQVVRLHMGQGLVAMRAQDYDSAGREFEAGLEAAVRHKLPEYEALSLNNLCYCRKSQNRYEGAVEACTRSIQVGESSGALRTAALAHSNLGSVYAYLGDFPASFEHQQKSIDQFRQMGAKNNLMIALGELGLTHDRNDETLKAIPYYQQAFDLATELKQPRDAARHADNMALALIKTEEWDRAAEWNERAAQLGGSPDSQPYVMRNRAKIAQGRGDAAGASKICRELLAMKSAPTHLQWEAWELLARIDAAAGRRREAKAEFQKAVEIIEGIRSELVSAQYRVTLLSRWISFYRSYVDTLVDQNDDAGALQAVESSRARVLAERLGQSIRPERIGDAGALRRFAREAKVSMVSFWVAPRRSFAWLVDAAGVRRFALPNGAEIERLVTEYRKVVEHSVADPLAAPEGRALWENVLAPFAAVIPRNGRVVVIPDGPLHRLNLETVAVEGPAPHYWLEDVEVAVAPSMAILMAKTGAGAPDGGVLAIGAPDYRGSAYQDLPGAKAELALVQARFPKAVVKTAAQATPAAYRESGPAQYAVIHFAAHAEANEEKPLESAVVLSRSGEGYRLHARDVIGIPIRAELVTLSACRSAGARSYAGEGLMGFAWAFLQAGARSVVAGLWEVSDDASGALMGKFYEGVAEKAGTSCALRDAKLAMLRGRWKKAFYWGAFQVYVGAGGTKL
jgi:CHAT domain-containing protein